MNGAPLEMLMPERFRGHHASGRARREQHPVTRTLGEELDLAGLRSDRNELRVEIRVSSTHTDRREASGHGQVEGVDDDRLGAPEEDLARLPSSPSTVAAACRSSQPTSVSLGIGRARVEALGDVAAELGELRPDRVGLDAFGHDPSPRLWPRSIVERTMTASSASSAMSQDERLVDLDRVDGSRLR